MRASNVVAIASAAAQHTAFSKCLRRVRAYLDIPWDSVRHVELIFRFHVRLSQLAQRQGYDGPGLVYPVMMSVQARSHVVGFRPRLSHTRHRLDFTVTSHHRCYDETRNRNTQQLKPSQLAIQDAECFKPTNGSNLAEDRPNRNSLPFSLPSAAARIAIFGAVARQSIMCASAINAYGESGPKKDRSFALGLQWTRFF